MQNPLFRCKQYCFRGGGTRLNAPHNDFGICRHLIQISSRLNCAFTLAEVLITLGIIGVVAAMTIPTLINNSQNRELQSALNKGYSEISQALKLMELDIGCEVRPQDYAPRTFVNSYKNYFKHIKFAPLSFQANDTETNDYNTMKEYRTYNKSKNVFYNMLDDGQFILSDGALIMINNEAYNILLISIDVNGLKKGPNIWGKDLFTFEINSAGKLLPMGADGTRYTDMSEYCSKNSSSNINGIGCTSAALSDADYFKKMY